MSRLKNDADQRKLGASPSSQQFRTLRRFILSHVEYESVIDELRKLDRLYRDREFETILDSSVRLQELAQLSPKFHYLVGCAAMECGDADLASESQRMFQICLEFLLESGDGSKQHPYQITYACDEQDILSILNASVRCQKVVNSNGRIHNVVTLHDGQDIWFDVDDMNKKLSHSAASRIAV